MNQLPLNYNPRVHLVQKATKSDLWYLIYRLPDGTRLNCSTGTASKMLAAARAKEKEQALLAGQFTEKEAKIVGPLMATQELTLGAAVDRFFELTAGRKSVTTLGMEKYAIKNWLIKQLGNGCDSVLLRDVSTEMCNDLIHVTYEDNPAITRHNVRRTINKVYKTLIRDGSFKGPNPVELTEPVRLKKDQRVRKVWVSFDHFKLILAASEESDSPLPLHDMSEFNWEVAVRTDEILVLEWTQIDFEKRLLYILPKPSFPPAGWSPKWDRERTLPLTDRAVEILNRQPRRMTAVLDPATGALLPAKLVFPKYKKLNGEIRYLRAHGFGTAWDTILERAGLKKYGYVWHDFRRSWNRYAAERGIPAEYRAAFLGHGVEVNQSNYQTDMDIEFVRARMGKSMTSDAAAPVAAVRDLFGVGPKAKKKACK